MKRLCFANIISTVFLLSTASTFAGNLALGVEDAVVQPPVQQNTWYVSAFGGASSLSDVATFTRRLIPGGRPGSPPTFVVNPNTVSFDRGYTYGATFGKHVFRNFRLEGELSSAKYDANNMEDGTRASGPATGDLTATYLLANIWYDIPLKSKLAPYIGGGIGAARVAADVLFGGGVSGYQDGGTAFAYQLGLGFTYPVSKKLNLDVGYRYKAVPTVDFTGSGLSLPIFHDGALHSSNLQIGLMYGFEAVRRRPPLRAPFNNPARAGSPAIIASRSARSIRAHAAISALRR